MNTELKAPSVVFYHNVMAPMCTLCVIWN